MRGLLGLLNPARLFYGWWIVIAGAVGFTLATGLGFHGINVFFPALVNEFGWSRTAISGAFALARVETGIMGPIEGFLTDRLGPRRVMLIGVPLMALGFIALSYVNSLLLFYLVFILGIAFGSGIGFSMPISAAVANWFHRKRGKAFGFMWTGHGFGGALVPLLGLIIVTWGWRVAATVAGLAVLVIGIPVALLMRHRPEDYGYLPDGEPPRERPLPRREADTKPGNPAPEEQEFTPREALKTPSFWLIAFSVALRQVVTAGVSVHFVILLVDKGLPQTLAAGLFGSMAFMTVPGRLGLAWLGDFLDKRLIMTVSMGIMGISVFFMSWAPGLAWFVPFMLIFAFVWGGLSALPLPLRAEYFGRRNFATIQGLMAPISTAGLMSGPLIAGRSYDLTNSYALAFNTFIIASLVGMVLIFAARRPRPSTAR